MLTFSIAALILSILIMYNQGIGTMNMLAFITSSLAIIVTVFIKYLSDSRLINIIYTVGQEFPKKPAKVIMNNSNLIYAIYPIHVEQQDVMETFFVNALLSGHLVNEGNKQGNYIIDENKRFRICDAENVKMRLNNETIYARYNTEIGKDNKIPLWLFGFLY